MPGGFPFGLDLCNATSSLSAPSSKGISVTAAAKSYGSFVTIIASTALDACWMCVRIWPTTSTSNRCFTRIAVGAAAAEKVIVNDLFASSGTSGTNFSEYWFPCCIPAGTRISAQCNNTAADANNIQIMLYDGAFTQMEGAAGVDSMGFITGNPSGTDVDPGATPSTYGAWTQLVASTARDYMGLMLCGGQNSTDNSAFVAATPNYFEIGIGAGGSELVLIPDYGVQNIAAVYSNQWCPFIPVAIPAGTRVAARTANGNVTAGTRVIGIIAYGVYQ